MIDRDTCMACSEYRHRVDNERIEHLEDIYRENMDNPEDIKVESYEGQFSNLRRQANKEYNEELSNLANSMKLNDFSFGRINPMDKSKESIQGENDELKAEIHRLKALARSNKFFTEKRHEDLMKYQDKQNEEIEELNRAVKQLKKIQTDYVETVIRIENLRIAEEFENTKLKAENKTLRKKARQALDMLDKEIDNRLNKEASAFFYCSPLDTVDYAVDWSEWLGDDTIKESVVEVTGPDIIDKVKKTTKRLVLIITGQVHGEKCYITHTIKTKERNGIIRTGSRTIKIEVKSS